MLAEEARHHVERLSRFWQVDVVEEGVAEPVPDVQLGVDARLNELPMRVDRSAQVVGTCGGQDQRRPD